MIRRIILEFNSDATLERATQEATEVAAVKQTNVYFQIETTWYKADYTPPKSASVVCTPLASFSRVVYDKPPKED